MLKPINTQSKEEINLNKLNKTELLSIIAKLKKNELINIINKYSVKQKGGSEGEILKETKNATRKSIVFNQSKFYKSNNSKNSMNNNTIYNNIYE